VGTSTRSATPASSTLFLQPSYKSTHIYVGTDVHNCIPRLWLARSYPGEHARGMLAIIFP
ncbi:unnamed protein product, partial [Ectocarpus sp. 8 AP-2014]